MKNAKNKGLELISAHRKLTPFSQRVNILHEQKEKFKEIGQLPRDVKQCYASVCLLRSGHIQ